MGITRRSPVAVSRSDGGELPLSGEAGRPEPPSAPCLRRGRLRHLPPPSGGRGEMGITRRSPARGSGRVELNHSERMKSEIRSPHMMLVRLVLQLTMSGCRLVSATRRPSTPWTRPC